MATLTIQLDDHLMDHAETVSERTGKSLSELFADYLTQFVATTHSRDRIVDPPSSEIATVGTLRTALLEAPPVDEGFVHDLDSIRSQQPRVSMPP